MSSSPSDEQQKKLQAMLGRLFEEHKQTIFERLDLLRSAVEHLRHGALDADTRNEAVSAAHKLAGSVGTFGFKKASELARECELLLEKDELSSDEISEIEQKVAIISAELNNQRQS